MRSVEQNIQSSISVQICKLITCSIMCKTFFNSPVYYMLKDVCVTRSITHATCELNISECIVSGNYTTHVTRELNISECIVSGSYTTQVTRELNITEYTWSRCYITLSLKKRQMPI